VPELGRCRVGAHCALAVTAATAVRVDQQARGGEGGGAAAVGAVEQAKGEGGEEEEGRWEAAGGKVNPVDADADAADCRLRRPRRQ
jgi:hypothetical protein